MAEKLKTATHFILKYMHYIICFLVVGLVITAVGNLQLFVSKQSLSNWNPDTSVLARFLWDIALLLIFILQHSLMATEWFKDWLAKWLNISVSERLIYVTTSSFTLLFLIVQWQSIPETFLWFVDTRKGWFLWTFFLLLHVVCWFILGLEILLMDFGEMVGVSQVQRYHNYLNQPLVRKARKLREIYSRMRHPGTVLLTAMLWLHPLMTLDRLLLACMWTTYMIGRHSFEESHYEFAEKYFVVQYTEKKSKSSMSYDYVEEDYLD